jgi:hypothetical protein
LIREGHARNVPLLEALAAVPPEEQREFYERAVVNLADAKRWASLPRWQRPMMAGTEQDRTLWKLFMVYRLSMEAHLTPSPHWTAVGIGHEMIQVAAMLRALKDHARFSEIVHEYGAALSHGQELGDRARPPWAR